MKCEKIRDYVLQSHQNYAKEKKENKILDDSIHYEKFFDQEAA